MKELKCSFTGVTDEKKQNFNNQRALLAVSVNNIQKNINRFSAILKLIFQYFENCTIIVGDTLQRHTLAMQSDKETTVCYDDVIALGDEWLAAHEKICKGYEGRIKIVRWDEWLNHPSFEESKLMIMDEMQKDSAYKQYFTESIDAYLNRYENRLTPANTFNRKKAESLCWDYLIEECAVFRLWPSTESHFVIYDGTYPSAMKETFIRFINQQQSYPFDLLNIYFNDGEIREPQILILDNSSKLSTLKNYA
jgi:hypothetical protein